MEEKLLNWTICVNYLLAGTCFTLAVLLRQRSNDVKEVLRSVEKQPAVLTVQELRQNLQSTKDDQEKYVVVSGLLLRNEGHQESQVKRRLQQASDNQLKLLKVKTQQDIQDGAFRPINVYTAELVKDCILLDESKPVGSEAANVLAINQGAEKEIDMVFNLKHTRLPWGMRFDMVKYVVLEGTSLTLLGLVKYEAQTEQFKMTDLAHVLTGGMHEVKRCLIERIVYFNDLSAWSLWMGTFCLSIGLFLHLRKRTRKIEQEKTKAASIFLQKNCKYDRRLVQVHERGAPECLICMDNVANIVFTPCNHLVVCSACQKLLIEQTESLICPLCRRQVNFDKCFTLIKR